MAINPSRLFNHSTQLALANESRDSSSRAKGTEPSKQNDAECLYRFDQLSNFSGFSPLMTGVLEEVDVPKIVKENLTRDPDNEYRLLRGKIAERFGVMPEQVLLGAGADTLIDMICRIFFSAGDRYLLPAPNYSRFEDFADRAGAIPVYVEFSESDHFQWTDSAPFELSEAIVRRQPKVLFLSNPVNPTGQIIPASEIIKIVKEAARCDVFVVVDESLGEYADSSAAVQSAAAIAERHPNLIVIRSFSKMYGIPNARVGYMICSSPALHKAVQLYLPDFPLPWFSLYVAQIAFIDDEFTETTRETIRENRYDLLSRIGKIPSCDIIPSPINSFLLRNNRMSADEFEKKLLVHGILTANVSRSAGLQNSEFLRLSVRSKEENEYLLSILKEDTIATICG